jgi:hypothetical protein
LETSENINFTIGHQVQISAHALLERTADLEAVVLIDCNISITEVDDLACTIEKTKPTKLKAKVLAVALVLLQPSITSGEIAI